MYSQRDGDSLVSDEDENSFTSYKDEDSLASLSNKDGLTSLTGSKAEELDETDETTEADAACESLATDSPESNLTMEESPVPVAGGGKTFEQLLEEELSEDQRQQTSSKSRG